MTEASSKAHTRRSTCRICGGTELEVFLELGPMPLANSFLRDTSEVSSEGAYPLDVVFCGACSAIQTPDVIDAELLFANYIYVSGTSDTIASHYAEYSQSVVSALDIGRNDLVVEIASNDGSLLRAFQEHEVRTLGVEPAANIAQIAREAGVETVCEFFDSKIAADVLERYGPARAVVANNVFAHVDHTVDFLRGCKDLLAEDGRVVIEVPYLGELLNRVEYDTIYHEHLCYFSISVMARLCEEVGLSVIQVDHVAVHGGSLRVQAGCVEHYGQHAQSVRDQIGEEQAQGFNDVVRYKQFAEQVAENRREVRELLMRLRDEGKTVAGYGAPAKGNTLLNWCGVGTDLLSYTVDKNPMKVGMLTPGTHIPVLDAAVLLERQPDYVLILAWNFAEEIMRQQSEYAALGGRFIIPVPKPVIV
ncbi:MAG: class I SAM-dependent methyltransferase [Myxococcota bacterium]|nr:class I SAM-dependent methyltransferase [Myxococcota bacterium]